jgi:hypothetical protein
MNNQEPENNRGGSRSPILLAAYLAHFLIPLVLLADSLRAIHAGAAGVWEKGAVAISAPWLLVGLGTFALIRDRRRFVQRISRPLIAFYTLCFVLGLSELGAGIWFRQSGVPLRYKPGSKIVVHPGSNRRPGVPMTATVSVNEFGLRGPSLPDNGRLYKIIAVGGSTTECSALDDSQEWPHLLMQLMNQAQKPYSVWVANAGVARLTTVDHISCLRRLPILSQADMLIFLIGGLDLQATLDFGGAPTQEALEYRAKRMADHSGIGLTPEEGFFRRSYLFGLGQLGVRNGLGGLDSGLRRLNRNALDTDADAQVPITDRRRPLVPLPDLQIGLREYTQRIRTLERECHARNLRCAFMTQPTMWRADLPPAEQSLLWMGWVGWKAHRHGFASIADLARAMDAYNQTLLGVCREDHLECYDLASVIPKDTSALYDDCHFNIGGARMVAEYLAARLLSIPPFKEDGRHVSEPAKQPPMSQIDSPERTAKVEPTTRARYKR